METFQHNLNLLAVEEFGGHFPKKRWWIPSIPNLDNYNNLQQSILNVYYFYVRIEKKSWKRKYIDTVQ